jgi:hypothetical protein
MALAGFSKVFFHAAHWGPGALRTIPRLADFSPGALFLLATNSFPA